MNSKKIIIYPVLLAGLVSCQGVEPEGAETLTGFGATVENQEETRTTISYSAGGGTMSSPVVLWQNLDHITLISSGGNSADFRVQSGGGTTSAYFTGTLSPATYPLYGIYPRANGGTLSDGNILFSLPQDNVGAANAANGEIPTFAYITSPDNIVFKNLCGLLRIQLNGTAQVKLISVRALGGEMLWGDVTLTLGENPDNPDSWSYSLANGSATLWARRSTAYQLPSSGYVLFYFAIPPGRLSDGIEINIYDENEDLIYTRTSSADLTITRSKIKPMNTLTINI